MFLHRTDFNQQYTAAHKLHHMYMDKQLQIWIASIGPTSGIVECPRIVIKQQNNGLCLHFDFWKVSGFFWK